MTMTHVNGVEIVARQKATSHAGSFGRGAEMDSIEQLLLADDTTVFHCVHKNAKDCDYVNLVMGGVMSHQRTHSDRMEAKRAKEQAAELAAQLAEIEAKEAQKRANYSAGAKKGIETRRAKQLQTPSEVGGAGNGARSGAKIGEPSKSAIGDNELAKKAQQVIIAYNALQDAHDQFQNVFLGYMRAAQSASAAPAVDPQILAKARQYDIIQNALKGSS